MPERITPVLRIFCLILAGLFALQLSRLAGRSWSSPDPGQSLLAGSSTAADAPPPASTNSANANTNATPPSPARSSGPAANAAPLPPAIQAQIDRITQSEVLGPIIRPLPMALLGIAGQDAFLRAPDGRVGLLREGEELGGVKLLRIGTNRVLIEHEQQRKELMLFSGFGSEPLLSKEKQEPK